jgi:ketosteroid isomerase-like protein
MSRDDAEAVRRIYEEGMLDRFEPRLLELLDPGVEFVNPAEAIESGTRVGIEGIVKALQNAVEAFDSARHELLDLFQGEGVVVAWVAFHTRSRGSEIEVTQSEAHTWTLREGRIVRFEWGRDLDAALDAAGIARAG